MPPTGSKKASTDPYIIFDPFTAPIDTNPNITLGGVEYTVVISVDYIPLMFLIFQGISKKSVALT